MRQIILDTETTGLDTRDGHRIIEIGCLELLNRKLTGNFLHFYFNPDRAMDQGAIEVHGISNDFLKDKPRFFEKAEEILNFIKQAELIIHNASFDLSFLNYELSLLDKNFNKNNLNIWSPIEAHTKILDSLKLARQMHPGQRNSLDALCKRYGVKNTHREFHGALKDSELLAQVYLAMTGGQTNLKLSADEQRKDPNNLKAQDNNNSGSFNMPSFKKIERPEGFKLKVVRASAEELKAHEGLN